MTNEIMQKLREPFAPEDVTWRAGATTKDGSRCMALAYADSRAYFDRLDAALGFDWQTDYVVLSDKSVLCRLTITVDGKTIVRSATAEDTDLMSAEARALKRACAAFGLGRSLYSLPTPWVEYDAKTRAIADAGMKQLDQRYRDYYQRITGTSTQPAGPAQRPQPKPQPPTNGNGKPPAPLAQDAPVWETWQTPEDAYQWAVESGVCDHIKHAKNAMKKLVNENFDGKLTKVNFATVMAAFYTDRVERAEAQPA